MSTRRRSNRRQFLQTAAAAGAGVFAAPYFVPAKALGLEPGTAAASERITIGIIGAGGKGRHNMGALADQPDAQIVAINDVDVAHLKQAVTEAEKKDRAKGAKPYADFRELLQHPDLDAVCVSTPDHWHALPSIAAAKAGKDIYCEKPLTNSIGEGRALCDAVAANKVILQTGSHERSSEGARRAAELVRNGVLGEVKTVRINLPCDQDHHKKVAAYREVPPAQPVPEGFDYNFWLGHTPEAPYSDKRCHFWWRFILAYGGGEMTDRGAHVIDIALMACDRENTGPVEIEATGKRTAGSLYDAFMDFKFVNTYADGFQLIGESAGPRGLKFEGTKGSLFVHVHGCKLEADAAILDAKIPESGVHLGRTPGHHRNFLDAVKSRKQPFAPAEAGHRTASVCHLNNIAMLRGKKLLWDPQKEQFSNDEEANRLVTPSMRAPWSLG